MTTPDNDSQAQPITYPEAATDPVVALVAEWKERRREYLPYQDAELGTPECERGEGVTVKVADIESALYEATPTTPQGVALLWQFLRKLGGLPSMTTAGVLLFALHPAGVEVVAWVAERKTLLAACFMLGAATCFLRAAGRRA